MHFEGSLSQEEEDLRLQVYEVLRSKNEAEIEKLMANPTLAAVIALPHDGENPTLGHASRLVREGISPLLLTGGGAEVQGKWAAFVRDLKGLLKESETDPVGAESAAANYYISQPWSRFRDLYRETRPEVREDKYLTVKATPYSGHKKA